MRSERRARTQDAARAGTRQGAEGGGTGTVLTEDRGLKRKDNRKASDEKHTAEERAGQAQDAPQDHLLPAPGTKHQDG